MKARMHRAVSNGRLMVGVGVLALCAACSAWAQTAWVKVSEKPPEVPREFRGAWVATVANIDWPSKRDVSSEVQQAEIKELVACAKRLNLNALIFQVRPCCDALYESKLEPWSEFLTGQSGKAPIPMYDPLAMWIEECHAYGIELHAWFNPFRARHFDAKLPDAANHVSNTMGDIVYEYDKYKWMDPGAQKSQDWAIGVIRDVVKRYDIDGVHIDDYFYPYPKEGKEYPGGAQPFPDDATYREYQHGGGKLAHDDWRRDCIDKFVARMYEMVKAEKPYIKVGISPFGIWRPGFPVGIEGYDAYAKLHADAKTWLNRGTLDYAAPQLYWAIDAPKQPFGKLLSWWIGESKKGRPVIPGLYTSKLESTDGKKAAWGASEIVNQIAAVRERKGAAGEIQFSMKALAKNYGGIADLLAAGVYSKPAVPPAFASCGTAVPQALAGVVCEVDKDGRVEVRWEVPKEVRVVVVGWKGSGEWQWEVASAASGGVDHAGAVRACIAPLSRAGVLGSWTVFGAAK